MEKFCPCCRQVVDVPENSAICPNCEFDFDTLSEEERRLADDPELGKKEDDAQFRLKALSFLIAAVIMVLGLILVKWLFRLIA